MLNGVRKDFDLVVRFEHINYKIEMIQTQLKFYLAWPYTSHFCPLNFQPFVPEPALTLSRLSQNPL